MGHPDGEDRADDAKEALDLGPDIRETHMGGKSSSEKEGWFGEDEDEEGGIQAVCRESERGDPDTEEGGMWAPWMNGSEGEAAE
ncbi:hypothetical protein Nepgr_005358 [Nepenthes gracilis]|uniref:Uncharacterized protein n=1 Tax=Nepenthes gracilis TaxID=150966 RepID=A0AAD3S3I4_NEPGR|nr:hypothetical protein Nepgr_005358 [Nepenthes gracilis]